MSASGRRPGRPSLREGEPSVVVTVCVPVSDYDRVCRLASRDRCSVPKIFRRALRLLPDDARDHDDDA